MELDNFGVHFGEKLQTIMFAEDYILSEYVE